MKNIFILIILFLWTIVSYSQLPEQEQKAINYLEKNKPDSALFIINSINKDADSSTYFKTLLKGWAYCDLKKIEKSRTILNKLLERTDSVKKFGIEVIVSSLAYTNLAKGYKYQGDTSSAISYFKKAIDKNPNQYAFKKAAAELKKLNSNYAAEAKDQLKGIGKKAYDFELQDIWGKKHVLSNYFGYPILLHFGTTWCGSCQMDAAYLENNYNKYAPRGVVFIKIFQGESPSTVIDYKKHYRSKIPTLIDYRNILTSKYNFNYYATTVIIDTTGTIVYNNNDIQYNKKKSQEAYKLIENMLSHQKTNIKQAGATCDSTKCFIPNYSKSKDTLRNDYFSKGVVDRKNNIWIVYNSDKNGNNDIYLRRYYNNKLKNEYQITRSAADDYNPDIAITPEQKLWIIWNSDREGNYNIYSRTYYNDHFSEIVKITDTFNDAFHPSIFADTKNNILLTYYKWDTIRFNGRSYSRDRDIFYKKFTGEKWTEETRVSPQKPQWDDHTDPVITSDINDNVYIAWSYDYHYGNYKNNVEANMPTIFYRKIDRNGNLDSNHVLIGTYNPKNRNTSDITPSITTSNNKIWCTWNSRHHNKRLVQVRNINSNSKNPLILSDKDKLAIEPKITKDNKGNIIVVWQQLENGKWDIYGSIYKNGLWSSPIKLTNSKNNCINPSIVIDNKNKKYLIYSESINAESFLRFKEIDKI